MPKYILQRNLFGLKKGTEIHWDGRVDTEHNDGEGIIFTQSRELFSPFEVYQLLKDGVIREINTEEDFRNISVSDFENTWPLKLKWNSHQVHCRASTGWVCACTGKKPESTCPFCMHDKAFCEGKLIGCKQSSDTK